ncbi:MAG: SPASM domain-containing protein [Candidatus Eremiobacteraeota bacterium]|nr:SPASM domain-containing protein [Candidatus Eremiobacteraeota bacterium]MCW5871077.1 SPASM domain-containing protein [Candidatus Eremiobacteraeota bacterium]
MILSLPIQQEPKRYAPVHTLMLYLTEECNLRCTYCFVKKEPKFMTRETALRTIDWLLQRNISGGEYELLVNFFGGEPFLAVDLMQEVVDYGRLVRPNVYKTFKFGATTNGTLANSRVEKVIREGELALMVSLDGGPGASRLRPMVSGRDSYSLVRKNLPKLAEWARLCTARVTFTPDNLELLKNVRDVLDVAPVRVALSPVVEADWSGSQEALEEAHQELGDWFAAEVRAGRRPPLEVTWELLRDYRERLVCQRRPARTCPVGEGLMAVDSAGNVLPCHRFLHRRQDLLGGVEAGELPAERWRFAHLTRAEIPDCQDCIARTVCGGGCRAVALDGGYGLEGVHPNHCLLMQSQMRLVARLYEELRMEENFCRALAQVHSDTHYQELYQLGS